MNERLKTALHALLNLDRTLKPVQLADAREAGLVEGLYGLAAEYGVHIAFTCINSNGEMAFNVKSGYNGCSGIYGEQLASWLSRVPHRYGLAATDSPVLPENSWCWINHFDVERLLRMVATEYDAERVV